MSKKQFTLDSWLKDKSQKVVTRCGFPVRIVCTDVKRKDYPILALVERDDQEEYQSFTKDGRFSLYNPLHDNFDLFIETADEVSEDEKVREELIKHLKEGAEGYESAGGSSDYQRWLAWLEKQNPKKHEEELENAYKTADKVQYKRGYEDAVKEMEKQGEKHPNPYNGISFEYNGHIWGMCARDNGVDISCDKHLIKHLEKQGEQKIEESKGNVVGISANWSEEDEKNLRRAIRATKVVYPVAADWLKSLRPQNHWKPSELQLGCLSDAIEYYNSSGYPAPKLKELLDDLKKLKEE